MLKNLGTIRSIIPEINKDKPFEKIVYEIFFKKLCKI